MTTPLKIIAVNARSVKRRHLDFVEMVNSGHPDLIVVNESKLKEGQCFELPGYCSLDLKWRNNSTPGTGTTIYYLQNLKTRNLKTIERNLCEFISLEIKTQRFWLKVGGIYCKNLAPCIGLIEDFFVSSNHCLFIGDLNSKHTAFGCRVTNRDGRLLERAAGRLDVCVRTSKARNHRSPFGWDNLCVALSTQSVANLMGEPIVLDDIGSDHLPMQVCVHVSVDTQIRCPPRYTLSNINWAHYRYALNLFFRNNVRPGSYQSTSDIDNSGAELTDFMRLYLEAHARRVCPTSKGITHQNPKLLQLLGEKKRLRNKLKRCADPTDQGTLRSEISLLNHKIELTRKKDLERMWKKACSGLNHRNPNFWIAYNRLFNHLVNSPAPELSNSAGMPASVEEIPNIFADHLDRPLPDHEDRWGNSHASHIDQADSLSVDHHPITAAE
ncbi:uncharacterized protein LOC115230762, partial [Octopus sinensis]|uniref:Uncharacterized protein LOC115230762 n=1 Tax=Octopus sinensis TaxID=2607531 RepID=A0A6P7U707_9MOLL